MQGALFDYLLRQGDTALILGHRLSEWCGVAPALEEDIAMANTALDLIGQTQMWLGYAAEVDGQGRTADDLAFRRDVWDFRNLLLVEQTNGDFGKTVMRQFLFDAFDVANLTALQGSTDPRIAEIAAKSVKEAQYHLERSRETVIALGDGTAQSNARMQAALDLLWSFTGEMFAMDDVDHTLAQDGTVPDLAQLQPGWTRTVNAVFTEAMLTPPESSHAQLGGKTGARHSEHLGHMLATMQFLPRAYPDARW
ncbi:1,2-phenylacetyl-CoA epoxidase subunit PaaC [Actibacterium sp. 188UL27-1]|uniref:1,2-phenylacetyl-CoA epoxidase subunit PaaC n=1 Tax=Actibacterium sp. 188UL27-1 TaxID=2786961 RepID=UPI00195BC8F5|nr:1,2-phenylacetyl-CoA epoxidase subunit PaaC [Actibacterium sp. 188UL27-1]MBM7067842.1 phenylacetate-CoA oxygenase subunit PaaC [Actibacterium sp. 188UL27-1]